MVHYFLGAYFLGSESFSALRVSLWSAGIGSKSSRGPSRICVTIGPFPKIPERSSFPFWVSTSCFSADEETWTAEMKEGPISLNCPPDWVGLQCFQ